jgi:hypothetical protein
MMGILKTNLKEIGWKVVDWINLAQDKDQWRAVPNTVMNMWVTENAVSSLSS